MVLPVYSITVFCFLFSALSRPVSSTATCELPSWIWFSRQEHQLASPIRSSCQVKFIVICNWRREAFMKTVLLLSPRAADLSLPLKHLGRKGNNSRLLLCHQSREATVCVHVCVCLLNLNAKFASSASVLDCRCLRLQLKKRVCKCTANITRHPVLN